LIVNPRVDLVCLKCGKATQLTHSTLPNYAWACPELCLPPIDTGVPATEELSDLDGRSPVEILFSSTLTLTQIQTAKVYAPQILIHFIDCHTPGCYEQIYRKFLVPHFDNVLLLDYVLRTSIVKGEETFKDGIPQPKMYGELLRRLGNLGSPQIRDYLLKTFSHSVE
jgi:hypothetical protein